MRVCPEAIHLEIAEASRPGKGEDEARNEDEENQDRGGGTIKNHHQPQRKKNGAPESILAVSDGAAEEK